MGGLRLSDLGTWSSRLLDSGTVGSGAQGLRITGFGGQGLSGVGLSVGRFRDLEFGANQRLHSSSFLRLPYRILYIYEPQKGTTMEP